MSLGVVSLVALFAAIIIGFLKKSNVGLICISLAFFIGIVYDISAKEIMSGFNSSLALTMIGVTYLFAIVAGNKTLEVLANKIVNLVGRRTYLIYVAMYVVGFILCAVGPGAIPTLALIPVLAVPVALSSGINPILLSVIGQIGVQSGRMTPITPEGVLVMELLSKQGLSTNLMPMELSLIVSEAVLLILVFIYFKGWKIEKISNKRDEEIENGGVAANVATKEKFNSQQTLSLIGLSALIICATAFKMNVGLTSFLIGSILIVLGTGNEQQSIKSIPWNIILLVLGVGILMNIIVISGGIDILSNVLQSVMGPKTASAVMTLVAGFMSFFSSGLGVVFPTLIPTASSIATNIGGVNPIEIVSAIVVGGTITGYSPISTTGSLVMAAVSQESEYKEKYPENKMFIQLFVVAFLGLIVSAILPLMGIFRLFN